MIFLLRYHQWYYRIPILLIQVIFVQTNYFLGHLLCRASSVKFVGEYWSLVNIQYHRLGLEFCSMKAIRLVKAILCPFCLVRCTLAASTVFALLIELPTCVMEHKFEVCSNQFDRQNYCSYFKENFSGNRKFRTCKKE